jgi:hypothetical protein
MHRTSIQSKAILNIGYDPAERRLEIRFRDGRLYHYRDVPAEVHRQFLAAPSKGSYFNEVIRGGFAHARSTEASLS